MKKFFWRFVLLCLSLLVLLNFKPFFTDQIVNGSSIIPPQDRNPAFWSADSLWVDSVMKTLSIEDKIAQLIMVAAYSNRGEEHFNIVNELIQKHHIGGLIFFQGGPVRQANLTNNYQKVSKVPLLIAIDGEWGLAMRLDSTISYPRQMTLGAIQDDALIYQMGYDIGLQCKRMGIHINFAPVADVNNNPSSPVINSRSFGENPYSVSIKAHKYAEGLRDAGVIATAKHFPGHGDTDADSHFTLPVIKHSYERLDSIELFPFKYLIERGLPAIMAAHLSIPVLDTTPDLASSLSPIIIDRLLRNKLQFTGLVFTDALNMKGVSRYVKPGEAELMAFLAGNDILLMPEDVPKAIAIIRREIRKGTISESELDYRCRKVLFAKAWAGLNNYKPVKLQSLYEDLNAPVFNVLRRNLIANSITVVKNENQALPLFRLENYSIASVTIGNRKADPFATSLRLYSGVDTFFISKEANKNEFDSLLTKLSTYNTLIVSLQETSAWPGSKYGMTGNSLNFLNNLNFSGISVLVVFGNPYSLSQFQNFDGFDAVVVGYEDLPEVKEIAAQNIFGALPVTGKLPVSANPFFKSAEGIKLDSIQRLSYGIPEEAGMNSAILQKIDTIAQEAISGKATPGCQILVARHGKVIFNKSYGYQTYRNAKKITNEDIYDIASLTKITSTVPSLMLLYDQNKFSISKTLGDYLPQLGTSNKAGLKILDVLTHQAGFQPWIPFYYKVIETLDTSETLFSTKYSDAYSVKLTKNTYANRNIVLKDGLISDTYSKEYPVSVAKDLYLRADYMDTIYNSIFNSELAEKKEYKYSDLGYYLFHLMIQNITGQNLYPYVFETFYSKLGATTMGYLPLNRFPEERIVPTENDILFRKQVLRGYVHDPGAAMLGGIAGHAGVFSSANDLAKMMQMYLNGGAYGGRMFISDTTIYRFTSCYNCINGNRRGLGFDKPEPDSKKPGPCCKMASSNSYGHSGFTGTLMWIDPDYDLIYIFLSNRIHPDQYNQKMIEADIRTRIQEVVYNSIIPGQ
jgi:beta-glucosidase-like glycosyl hydrolase/CubicO group peptidase (beta-lactamase class C family)